MSLPVSHTGHSFSQIIPIVSNTNVSINTHDVINIARLPGTKNLDTEETVTLLFPTLESLRKALTYQIIIDDDIVEKFITKLSSIIGKPIYPSQLTKSIFELAFTDEEHLRLTPKQRTDNIGYILSNLGCGQPEVIEKLYAFYYAYAFENFASARS